MASKPGRKLPQWYLDKVNLAAEVFRGSPDGVDTSRPHVVPRYGNQGVAAQRQGVMTNKHKAYTPSSTSDTQSTEVDPT